MRPSSSRATNAPLAMTQMLVDEISGMASIGTIQLSFNIGPGSHMGERPVNVRYHYLFPHGQRPSGCDRLEFERPALEYGRYFAATTMVCRDREVHGTGLTDGPLEHQRAIALQSSHLSN